jgi:nucleotide-binding universal stress UspA family protein
LAAFNIVKRLKSAGADEVVLLHVQDERAMEHRSAEQLAKFDEEDMARLETMRKALVLRGLPGRFLMRHGLPFTETLKVAEEEDVSLIVMGSRGRSAVAELLTGSTFKNVVRQSRRPVLVIQGEDD